jgi:hypothetical protein
MSRACAVLYASLLDAGMTKCVARNVLRRWTHFSESAKTDRDTQLQNRESDNNPMQR